MKITAHIEEFEQEMRRRNYAENSKQLTNMKKLLKPLDFLSNEDKYVLKIYAVIFLFVLSVFVFAILSKTIYHV